MTKRLTPEEDAQAVRNIGPTGRIASGGPDAGGFAIDKTKYDFEITREGERFIEVTYNKREEQAASASPGNPDPYMPSGRGSNAAVPWGGLSIDPAKLVFAGDAQEKFFTHPGELVFAIRPDPECTIPDCPACKRLAEL